MEDKDLEKFDPTVAELTAMVKKTSEIKTVDFNDKAQMVNVHVSRMELKNVRVKIEKYGKGLREDAIAFQKKVIAKEKELIGIIEPEEDRLAEIEKQAEVLEVKRLRAEKLPERKAKLASISKADVEDEALLGMDDLYFDAFFNQCVSEKNEADRLENERVAAEKAAQLEEARLKAEREAEAANERVRASQEAEARRLAAEKAKIDADRLANEREAERLAAEKAAAAREEKAREEERVRAAEEAKRKEADRIAAEKLAAEEVAAKAEVEKKHREKLAAYKAFRESHGWTPGDMSFKEEVLSDGSVVLYKKLGIFIHKV